MWPITTITNLSTAADTLRRRRYGVIEMREGRLAAVHLRPWPTLVSIGQARRGERRHLKLPGDCCRLYYNQPLWHSNFLSLVYVFSTRSGSIASLYGGQCVLEEIARLKGSDALLCEASNDRISDRLMHRWGWTPHVPDSPLRHYIKRFYGEYPAPSASNAYGIPAWGAQNYTADSVVHSDTVAV